MPVTVEWKYTDGTSEIDRIPAEAWRLNEYVIQKTFIKTKEVSSVVLDPNFEFADIDMENNTFPRTGTPSAFDKIKEKQ